MLHPKTCIFTNCNSYNGCIMVLRKQTFVHLCTPFLSTLLHGWQFLVHISWLQYETWLQYAFLISHVLLLVSRIFITIVAEIRSSKVLACCSLFVLLHHELIMGEFKCTGYNLPLIDTWSVCFEKLCCLAVILSFEAVCARKPDIIV